MWPLLTSGALFFMFSDVLASNSVNFTVEGVVTAQTCKVVSDEGMAVAMPLQRTGALMAAGAVAGKTRFRISVENCTANYVVYFHNDQNTVNSEGRLVNTALSGNEGARGVELQILNAHSEPVDLTAASGFQKASNPVAGDVQGDYSFEFFVQYYSTGTATGGQVESALTFLVELI